MIVIIQFFVLMIVVFLTIEWALKDYANPIKLFKRSKLVYNLNSEIDNLYSNRILSNKIRINAIKVIVISIIIFLISTLVLYIYIKVLSTSVILSIPFLLSPLIISKILIRRNKEKISKQIPFYTINIKNQMKEENDIIQAIKRAKVEEPLAKYIEKFKLNVFSGMNVITAFERLKNDVGVKEFSELVDSFEVCYKNGGDFVKILEKFILMKTKERMQKEETEEKAFSSVITLIVMMLLSVFVIITFVFANDEYANIIRTTVGGKVILNINAISYMVMSWIITRVYREE